MVAHEGHEVAEWPCKGTALQPCQFTGLHHNCITEMSTIIAKYTNRKQILSLVPMEKCSRCSCFKSTGLMVFKKNNLNINYDVFLKPNFLTRKKSEHASSIAKYLMNNFDTDILLTR